MRFPLFIARRYLFARKSHHIINTISMISAVGIAVGTAALIIVLSVYNGFGRVVEQMYHQVDADLRIEAKQGTTFLYQPQSEAKWQQLASDPRVKAICPILEEHVFVTYDGRQSVAVAKGVDSLYEAITPLAGQLVEGDFELHHGEIPQVVVGRGIARDLGIMIRFLDPLEVYYPDPERAISLMNPAASLRSESFFVVGKVALEQQFDQTYFFAPIDRIRHLTARSEHAVSYLEVHLTPQTPVEDFQKTYSQILGEDFRLLDRYQQNETIYKMMTYEKVAIFLIFFFILLIVACNVFGSLSMLILEKKADIQTFRAMGTRESLLRRIFLYEGMLITGLGAAVGMVLGLLLCWLQQTFGWIQMPGNFIVQAYPIEVHFQDVLWVFTGIFLISSLLSALPAYNRHLFLLALLLLPVGCRSTSPARALAQVESYIHSDPERALAVLDSMDRQELTSRRDRAHYALLKSMALDKNYIDLTSDSVIAPAVAYYSKHGTANQKMKAYFYQGVVYFNARYLPQALLSFYQAQECMESSEDARLKGIIYMTLSDLYELLYDSPMVKKYLDKGIEQFMIAQDTTQYKIALLQKAVYCQSVNEVAVADSLYSELLEEIETLPSYSAKMLLTNYAKFCMINPVPKAQEAIQLYEKLFNEYGYRLQESHAGPLAYAYELVGDSCTANYIFQRFENDENPPLAYWKYLSEKNRGNLDKALIELEHVSQTQSHLFQRKMSIGEEWLLIQYLEEKNAVEKQEKFILVLLLLLLLMFVTFIAFYINANLKMRSRKATEKLQSMLLAANEVNELMRMQHDSVRKDDLSSQLQKEFFRKYKTLLTILADLYTAYYASGDFNERRAAVYGYVDKVVQNMRDSDRLTTAIIQEIKQNTPYGEAIDSLKLNTKEQEIFCYYFMGLKPQLISVVMDIDLQNVYKIRSRMKRKIGLLDQSARDFLLTHF